MQSVFSLNAKKVRICMNMSGGFAVITQRKVKSAAVIVNFFAVVKIFGTNCFT